MKKYVVGFTLPIPWAGGLGGRLTLVDPHKRANACYFDGGIGGVVPDIEHPVPHRMWLELNNISVDASDKELGIYWKYRGVTTPLGCGRGFDSPEGVMGNFSYAVAVVAVRGPHLFDDDSIPQADWPRRCATFARELAIGAENNTDLCYPFRSVYSVQKMSAEEWGKRLIFNPYGIPPPSLLAFEGGIGGHIDAMLDMAN